MGLKPVPEGSPWIFGPLKRKRKKRRKRRTPRTSSLPGRARRRQRQWSACNAGFTGDDVPRVMFPSGVARPKMLRILAGIDQKDRCSGIFKAGFAGYNTPRAVLSFLSFLVRRLMKLCIMAGMVQKDSCSGMARLVLLVTVYLVLCFLPCLQARDAWHHGRYGPGGLFRHVQGLVCWYLSVSLALSSSWLSQAQDARHHGWHGPQDRVEVHRCSSWTRFSTCPLCAVCGVMVQTVQYTVWRFPQLQFITVVDTPFRCAVAVPHGPDFS